MRAFDDKFAAVSPIAKFRRFLVKYCKRSKNFFKCLDLMASSQPSNQ